MSRHRDRKGNAYRAGARDGIAALLDALLAITPLAAHAALRGLADQVSGQCAAPPSEKDKP